MPPLAVAAIVAVDIWLLLVVVAHVLTEDHDLLREGMSALARGRARWLMKVAFAFRGLAALALVAAIPLALGLSTLLLVGLAFFWVWGLGSALLAVYDTDLPGEAPTTNGRIHALAAAVAYVAAAVGMIVVSYALRAGDGELRTARWALPIALVAALAMVLQFAGFGAAAKEARTVASGPPRDAAPAPVPAPLAAGPVGGRSEAPAVTRALASFAGLFQRVFLALVMVWIVVVAAGL